MAAVAEARTVQSRPVLKRPRCKLLFIPFATILSTGNKFLKNATPALLQPKHTIPDQYTKMNDDIAWEKCFKVSQGTESNWHISS